MLESHLRAEPALFLIEHIVDVIDARNAVVTHLDFGHEIAQQLVEILGLERSCDDIIIDVHDVLVAAVRAVVKPDPDGSPISSTVEAGF